MCLDPKSGPRIRLELGCRILESRIQDWCICCICGRNFNKWKQEYANKISHGSQTPYFAIQYELRRLPCNEPAQQSLFNRTVNQKHMSIAIDPGATLWIQAHSSNGLYHHRTVNLIFYPSPVIRCYTPIVMPCPCWRPRSLRASAEVYSASFHACERSS